MGTSDLQLVCSTLATTRTRHQQGNGAERVLWDLRLPPAYGSSRPGIDVSQSRSNAGSLTHCPHQESNWPGHRDKPDPQATASQRGRHIAPFSVISLSRHLRNAGVRFYLCFRERHGP